MWTLVITAVLLLFLLYYLLHSSKVAKEIDKIHGPKGYPVIGNVTEYFTDPVAIFERQRFNIKTFERFHKLWMLGTPVLCMYDPDDTEVLLSSSKFIVKGNIYKFLHPWLNDGLVVSKGSKWQSRRKILTPAFHFNILRHFCGVFEEQSRFLVDKFKAECDGKTVEIFPYVAQFALNAICETAMGSRLDGDSPENGKYKNAIYEIGDLFVHRMSRIWMYPDVIFNLSSNYKRQEIALKTLHGFTTNVIQQRRETFQSDNVRDVKNNDDNYFKKKKRMAMLDLLLKSETIGAIDELGIREEVDTFMFEGHDTTAIGITYTLLLLANHRHIQDKIYEELLEIFEDSDRPASIEDLNKMRYLECCIKEALRLFPSVPVIMRENSEEMQLRDYLIPANTTIILFIFDLHRNPKYFPSPEKFDPDRFLPENCAGRHPFAYIPFSAGPRNCIGQKFAILEEKSVISNIVRNFVLEPVTSIDDLIFTSDIVLRTKSPIEMRLIRRTKLGAKNIIEKSTHTEICE